MDGDFINAKNKLIYITFLNVFHMAPTAFEGRRPEYPPLQNAQHKYTHYTQCLYGHKICLVQAMMPIFFLKC